MLIPWCGLPNNLNVANLYCFIDYIPFFLQHFETRSPTTPLFYENASVRYHSVNCCSRAFRINGLVLDSFYGLKEEVSKLCFQEPLTPGLRRFIFRPTDLQTLLYFWYIWLNDYFNVILTCRYLIVLHLA